MLTMFLPLQYQYRPPVFHRGAEATLLRPSDKKPARRRVTRHLGVDGLRAAPRGRAAQGSAVRGHAAARRRPRQAGQPPLAKAEDRQGKIILIIIVMRYFR